MAHESELIKKLNMILRQEHACSIRYATHAAVITGPYAEAISARLKEISQDEVKHAEKLRDRIITLGGKPTLEVATEDLQEAYDLSTILKVNMLEESQAIKAYLDILHMVPKDDIMLYRTLEDIIQDEQDHLEELSRLLE